MSSFDGKLIKRADFIRRTGVAGKFRSPELQAIDQLLADFEMFKHLGSDNNLDALRDALEAWQAKEGPNWENSSRNKNGAVSELNKQIFVYEGPQTLMDADRSHSRLGVLKLFGNTRANAETFKFVAGSTIDILSKATSIEQIKNYAKVNKHANRGATAYGIVAALAKEIVPAAIPPAGEAKIPDNATADERSTWEKITQYLSALGEKIFRKVVAKAQQEYLNRKRAVASGRGAMAYQALNDLWAPISALIKGIIGKVAEKVVPIAGSALQALKGVKNMCEAIYDRYVNYSTGKSVEYNDGHPAVVVKAITRAMDFQIGKGVYEMAKGAALTAVAGITAGALAIAEIVASAAEMIILIIYRIVEVGKINAFCEDCRERLEYHQERSSIHNDPIAFKKWFGAAAMSTPAIAALALTSHMTGDKMQYLKLYDDEVDIVTQAAFDRGVVHMDELKAWSYKYLNSTGYGFYSDDPQIAATLAQSTNVDFKPLSIVHTTWKTGAVKQKTSRVRLPFKLKKSPVDLPGVVRGVSLPGDRSGMGGHRGFI